LEEIRIHIVNILLSHMLQGFATQKPLTKFCATWPTKYAA